MKKNYLSLFISILLFSQLQIVAQTNSHQPAPPPSNPGFPFQRGMYIDCADAIITDISSGNILGLEQQLINYILGNYITYVVLCDLENSNVFGNPSLENALGILITDLRTRFPGIQIGISGDDATFFNTTGYLKASDFYSKECFPFGQMKSMKDAHEILNNSGPVARKKNVSELCKFFTRAAVFGKKYKTTGNTTRCNFAFDALYLQYRYWEQTSSLQAMQNEFENFKSILNVMQMLKCSFTCIKRIDAEFLPTNLFKLQGWTAIDQITEADPIIDRLMVPVFTNNANGVFDQVCKTLHFLSDRFSKPHSEIFIELSAESTFFNYCNSPDTPQDYLGDYLNGSVTPSGNMYSVENMFLDKFNSNTYLCSACSCQPYTDNHYSPLNTRGNILSGAMWREYTMLNDHNLFRNSAQASITEESTVIIQLIDISGRLTMEFKSIEELNKMDKTALHAGIYFIRKIYSNGKSETRKILVDPR